MRGGTGPRPGALFDRRQNRLRLNKYGEIFLAHAVRAMNELSSAEDRISTLVDPGRGVVSLGFLHSFGTWLIPGLLDRYQTLAPNTSFELEGDPADSVVDAVRKGRIDIGFVAPPPVADDLQWVPLGVEELCLEVPAGHVPLSDANACRHYGAVTRLYGPSGSAARAFLQFIIDNSPLRTDSDAPGALV